MSRDELSFSDLKCREIINEVDGRRLGRVRDLVFSPCRGHVLGIVAPFHNRVIPFFKGEQVYIPFRNIVKIGPDIILVRLTPDLCRPDSCIDLKKCRPGDGHHGGGHGGHHDGKGHGGERHGKHNERHEHRRNHGFGGHRDERDDDRWDEQDESRREREEKREERREEKSGGRHECDHRCEKCMLFDCDRRWKNIK